MGPKRHSTAGSERDIQDDFDLGLIPDPEDATTEPAGCPWLMDIEHGDFCACRPTQHQGQCYHCTGEAEHLRDVRCGVCGRRFGDIECDTCASGFPHGPRPSCSTCGGIETWLLCQDCERHGIDDAPEPGDISAYICGCTG